MMIGQKSLSLLKMLDLLNLEAREFFLSEGQIGFCELLLCD